MTNPDVDRLYLLAAIRLAEKGLYTVTRNNPRVGCLLVKHGRVIGRGFHSRDGADHAEIVALKRCEESPKSATAYVSLEPCCIQGRTPPCTAALVEAGIIRVVCAEKDPHPHVCGKGIEELKRSGVEVSLFELAEARRINPGYRKRITKAMPFVRIKTGMSLDGRIAMSDGNSQWITSPEARSDVQRLRARSGAIISGIGTVLRDNPRFTVREDRYAGCNPLRIVFDTNGRMPADAEILRHEGDVIVVCNANAAIPCKLEKWTHTDAKADLACVLSRLAARGVNEVLVEAGSKLTGSFIASGLWDELVVFVAPKLLGTTAMPLANLKIEDLCNSVNGRVESIARIGPDLRLVISNSNMD